jgi:hypothetical protein
MANDEIGAFELLCARCATNFWHAPKLGNKRPQATFVAPIGKHHLD